jgi:hypothetical protein
VILRVGYIACPWEEDSAYGVLSILLRPLLLLLLLGTLSEPAGLAAVRLRAISPFGVIAPGRLGIRITSIIIPPDKLAGTTR